MSPASAASLTSYLSLPLALALALYGALAVGAPLDAGGAVDTSNKSAETPNEGMVAEHPLGPTPQTAPVSQHRRGGTVKVEQAARTTAAQHVADPGPAGPAQMVFIDPVTGEWTSSPPPDEQMLLFSLSDPALNTPVEDLEMLMHPDGSVSVDLQGRFQSRVFATIDGDGKLSMSHSPSATSQTAAMPADSAQPNATE